MMNDIEDLWSALLSGNADTVWQAWNGLASNEAQAVLAHLQNMVTDADYSEAQKMAARTALAAIDRP